MNNLSVSHNFNNLKSWIASVSDAEKDLRPKKKVVFSEAVKSFEQQKLKSTYTAKQLPNLADYVLTPTTKPKYFKDQFDSQKANICCSSTPDYYDYKAISLISHSEYWVDFANRKLGGGAFANGFVQEEIMVAEMPDLANHIAGTLGRDGRHSTLETRYGRHFTGASVKEGSPSPIVFKGVTRVQKVEGVYGRALEKVTDIRDHLKSIVPQRVNIIAMAAPCLKDKAEGANLDVVEDLFNTAVAGFASSKSAIFDKSKRSLVHTGQLGAGCFNNNARVVYVVQKLAAQHLDVDIAFHGYDDKTARLAEDDYSAILNRFYDAKTTDRSIEHLLSATSDEMKARLR